MKKVLSCILLFSLFFFTGCIKTTKEEYLKIYNNEENFITLTGEITQCEYKNIEASNRLNYTVIVYVKSGELEKYIGTNSDSQEFWAFSDLYLNLAIGDKITFTLCKKNPKGTAWLPIVEIIKEEKTLLDYKSGKENLLAWVDQLQYK